MIAIVKSEFCNMSCYQDDQAVWLYHSKGFFYQFTY